MNEIQPSNLLSHLGVQVCGRSLKDPPPLSLWWLMSSVLDHFAKQGATINWGSNVPDN